MRKKTGFYSEKIKKTFCFREQTEENLLNLLEDTCNKINAASNL